MKKFILKEQEGTMNIAKFELPEQAVILGSKTVQFPKRMVTAYQSMVSILKDLQIPLSQCEGGESYSINLAAPVEDNKEYFFVACGSWVKLCDSTLTQYYKEESEEDF
jgi:hypothetical protein